MDSDNNKIPIPIIIKANLKMNTSKLLSTLVLVMLPFSLTAAKNPCILNPISLSELLELPFEELFNVEVNTAAKSSEQMRDASAAISVYNRQEILSMGVQTVEELLNYIPGFIATREIVQGQGWMVAARGRTTPQTSYHILFLLNGQRLNDDRSGGALLRNRMISIHNIERIEVVRGPGSALYGTSAFSGVVNIITRQCTENLGEFAAQASSFEGYDTHLNFFRTGKNWHVTLSGRYFGDRGDSYNELFHADVAEIRDPQQGHDIMLNAVYGKMTMTFHHSKRNFDEFYIGSESATHADTQYALFNHSFLGLEYTVWDKNTHGLKIQGNYSWRENQWVYEALSAKELHTSSRGKFDAALMSGAIGEEREWQLAMDGYYELNDQHTLFAGVEWRQPDNTKDRFLGNYSSANINALVRGILPTDAEYIGSVTEGAALAAETYRTIYSIYLQDKYTFSNKFSATLGVRYDDYSDFGSSVNPRLAFVYAPSSKKRLKLLYGEAFRAPSILQLSGFVGNPNLQPEKVKTLEVLWMQEYSRAFAGLTWYRSWYSNMIDTVLQSQGGRRFENIADTMNTSGIELEAQIRPFNNMTLRVGYSYAYETEKNPKRFPAHTLSFIANYKLNAWNFNVNTYYHDEIAQDLVNGSEMLDSYSVINFNLRYALNNATALTFLVKNLLDNNYASSVKAPDFSNGLENRGRGFWLGIEYNL
jgi:outer membrane receptor for ferrienterochelin and colicins